MRDAPTEVRCVEVLPNGDMLPTSYLSTPDTGPGHFILGWPVGRIYGQVQGRVTRNEPEASATDASKCHAAELETPRMEAVVVTESVAYASGSLLQVVTLSLNRLNQAPGCWFRTENTSITPDLSGRFSLSQPPMVGARRGAG